MKKVTFCFITIVLILTLGGIGLTQGLPSLTESSPAPPSTPPTPVTVPPTITSIPVSSPNVFSYTDPTCSFKFNYPSAWKPYDEIDDTGTCKAEIDLFEGDYIIAAFAIYVENYESSLASYAISVEEWMMDPQNMPEYYKINEEAVTIGDLPAIKRFYTWNKIHQEDNSKIPIKAVDVYLLKDKKGYILEGQVVQDKFEQILPELEIMFNNFTLSGVILEPATSESGLPPVTVTFETVSSSSISSTIEEIAFKFCPYCGTPLNPDYKFCPGCGNSIPVQRSVKAPKKIGVRSAYPTNLNFSYLNGLGKHIAFNPNLGVTFRGGAINQLGSSLKNLGKEISLRMVVSQFPPLEKTWILRSSKKGAQKNVSMGSLIGGISSKIGGSVIDQTRSSSLLGGSLSILGQGITYEIGAKREAETLPSLTPTSPQTTPILPTIPPSTGPEGIVSPTPGAPAQGGITLTPPGQPVPAQPGPGGIVLPTPNTLQEPQIIWKQYSLNQAFSHDSLITGYLEYPSTWLVNLDSFNKNVTFSEDASGLTSLTLFPGITGQFSSAQDLAQQMSYLLQQQVPDLSILNQEFKILPTPGSGAIEMTSGRVSLQGNYQGTALRFNLETYLIYTGVYGLMNGMGYAILTQSPQGIFIDKEQKYFNRMILSYKRALGLEK